MASNVYMHIGQPKTGSTAFFDAESTAGDEFAAALGRTELQRAAGLSVAAHRKPVEVALKVVPARVHSTDQPQVASA